MNTSSNVKQTIKKKPNIIKKISFKIFIFIFAILLVIFAYISWFFIIAFVILLILGISIYAGFDQLKNKLKR